MFKLTFVLLVVAHLLLATVSAGRYGSSGSGSIYSNSISLSSASSSQTKDRCHSLFCNSRRYMKLDSCVSQYCECTSTGRAVLHSCPGDLVFDPEYSSESGRCVHSSESAACRFTEK